MKSLHLLYACCLLCGQIKLNKKEHGIYSSFFFFQSTFFSCFDFAGVAAFSSTSFDFSFWALPLGFFSAGSGDTRSAAALSCSVACCSFTLASTSPILLMKLHLRVSVCVCVCVKKVLAAIFFFNFAGNCTHALT